jgi:hypothetical protein
VAALVALPGLAALVVVLVVERWLSDPERRPHTATLAVAAVLGTVALAFAAVLAVAVIVVRRLGMSEPLARLGRIVVPAGLAVVTVAAAWYLVAEAVRIL